MKQLLLWIILVLFASLSTLAQAPDPSFRPGEVYQTGEVRSVAAFPDGSVVVLGQFAFLNGGPAPNLVRFTAEGYYDPTFRPEITEGAERLYNIRPMPGGKLLLVGRYGITVGGHSSGTLFVLQPDGKPDTNFTFNLYSYASLGRLGGNCTLVQPDGKIVVADIGIPTNSTGSSYGGMARLNTDGSLDTSFTPNSINEVHSMALQPDGRIVLGGAFYYIGNKRCVRLARLNADGTVDPSFEHTVTSVVNEVVVQPDGRILVGGMNSNSLGTPYFSGLHRLLPNGKPDLTFQALGFAGGDQIQNPLDARNLLLQPDGRIVAAIVPERNLGQPRLMRYLPDGSPDPSWPTSLLADSPITTLALRTDNTLLAGGAFTRLANRLGCLAAFTQTGLPSPTFSPKFYKLGSVEGMARQPDGKLLVVGDFAEINGVEAHKVARLLANGDVDPTFRGPAAIAGPLLTVAVQPDNRVLIGGDLNAVNGQQRLGAARLLADGTFDPTFNLTGLYYNGPDTRQRVLCIDFEPGGKILLGGSLFHSAGGAYRFNLLRVQPDGSLDYTFTARLGDGGSGEVRALKRQAAGLLVGGVWFAPRPVVLTRLLADGSQDPTFSNLLPDPTPSGIINGIAELPDGRLVVAGRLLVAFQRQTNHMVRLQPNGMPDTGFTSGLHQDSYVNGLALQPNGRLLLWGTLGAAAAPAYLQRANPDGSPDVTFNVGQGPDKPVKTMLLLPDGALVIGGGFQKVNGWHLTGLARLVLPFVLQASGPRAAAPVVHAFPNPVRHQLHLQLAAGARQVALLDMAGRTVWQQAAPPVASTVPVRHLPAGVYWLRVSYASGPVVQRVVVE